MPHKESEAARAYRKAYRESHSEKIGSYMSKWRVDNKERIKTKKAEYYQSTKEAVADRQRQAKYGLGPEAFSQMLEAQNGVCAVCKQPSSRKLHVDHSHETGKVRGLLCSRCNTGIGQLRDSADVIRAALVYVETHSG